MNEMSSVIPGRLASRAVLRLRALVRLSCVSTYIIASLLPIYVPRSASFQEATHYLTGDQFLLVEEGFVMKTASITEQGHRLAYSAGIMHRVGSGESLHQIASLYDLSLQTILWANNRTENDTIYPDDSLLILPVDGVLHTVRRGQSLSKIASLYGVPLEDIVRQNQLEGSRITVGRNLIIPGGTPLPLVAKGSELPRPVSEAPGREVTPEPPRPTPAPPAQPPASYGIFQKPCDCTYTQYYHPGHYAIDMARNGGGQIFAAVEGIVTRADHGWNGGYGNVVEIDHGNGLHTLYAHNRTLHVREGSVVRRGDVIATMGNTGRVYGATGVHLHFEVIQGGVKKNPLLYLQ